MSAPVAVFWHRGEETPDRTEFALIWASLCEVIQGRKNSRRKSRGRKSAPAQLTADGNADRIRIFEVLLPSKKCGSVLGHMGHVMGRESLIFPIGKRKKHGLRHGLQKKKGTAPYMNENQNRKETKRKFALWIRESTLDLTKKIYRDDNCSSQSEFIEKAILFYAGYLTTEDNKKYLPNVVTSTLKSIVAESDNRISRMLFKIAVELAITMNVVASTNEVDEITLERLRGECVKEVKRLNGSFSFDDAVKWQKG